MDPKLIGAFGVLSMCCICSSIVSGVMSGGSEEPPVTGAGAGAGGDDAGAADADPSCSLQRGDNVQYCGGYVYQDTTNAQTQCVAYGGNAEPIAFIWDDTEQSACGINRGDIVQKCGNYIYQKESDANAQCVAHGGTNSPVPFIPTE